MRLLEAGFVIYAGQGKDFVPVGNWYGLELRHPEIILQRGEQFAVLSIQGMQTPSWILWENPELAGKMAIRYIGLSNGEWFLRKNVFYETASGVLPSIEVFEKFTNE